MSGNPRAPEIRHPGTHPAEHGRAEAKQAVALHFDRAQDEAPRIVAKGHGRIAEQIMEIAFAHGVKVREDAELVEILGLLEVESLIPLEAYAAVAEILSYVYRANASAKDKAAQIGSKAGLP